MVSFWVKQVNIISFDEENFTLVAEGYDSLFTSLSFPLDMEKLMIQANTHRGQISKQ